MPFSGLVALGASNFPRVGPSQGRKLLQVWISRTGRVMIRKGRVGFGQNLKGEATDVIGRGHPKRRLEIKENTTSCSIPQRRVDSDEYVLQKLEDEYDECESYGKGPLN